MKMYYYDTLLQLLALHNDLILGELSIFKMGGLDIGVNCLDIVFTAKLYGEDELKI